MMDADNTRLHYLPLPLLLGDPLLDSQHDDLLRCLHELKGLAPEAEDYRCSEIVSELTGKIVQHFDYEEQLMRRLNVPEDVYRAHVAAHQEIIDQISNLHLNSMLGGYGGAAALAPKVAEWVLSHMLKYDLSLKLFIARA